MPSPAGAAAPALNGRLLLAIALVAMATLVFLGAHERTRRRDRAPLDLSPEQEVALGRQSSAALVSALGGLDADSAVQHTVQEVGGRLVTLSAAATSSDLFDFQVVAEARTPNAFALPAGSIFVTRALYARLENEAQLAGVLAHEMAHVLGHHATQQLARTAPRADGAGASDASRLLELQYEEGDERAADELGVELMTAAGYDPRALIGAMRLLEPDGAAAAQAGFGRSHPDSGDRAARIEASIERRFPGGVGADLTLGGELRGRSTS